MPILVPFFLFKSHDELRYFPDYVCWGGIFCIDDTVTFACSLIEEMNGHELKLLVAESSF